MTTQLYSPGTWFDNNWIAIGQLLCYGDMKVHACVVAIELEGFKSNLSLVYYR